MGARNQRNHDQDSTNNQGGQAVVEINPVSPSYRNKDGYFCGSEVDASLIEPTINDVITELQNSINAWHGEGEEVMIWNTRCLYKAMHILQGMTAATGEELTPLALTTEPRCHKRRGFLLLQTPGSMSATALTFLITLSSAAPADSRRNFLATHAGLRDVFYRTDSIHVHRPGLEAQRLGIIRQDSGSASVSLNEERDQHGKPRFGPTLLLGATHAERLKIEVLT